MRRASSQPLPCETVSRRPLTTLIASIVSLLSLVGCSKSGVEVGSSTSSVESVPAESVPAETAPVAVTTTTSLAPAPTNFVEAAAQFVFLAKQLGAADYTVDVSHSECGVFAMMIVKRKLAFYSWDGTQWNDQSTALNNGLGRFPDKVYSRDFTLDGVTDFFVTYADEQRRGRKLYGGFFGFPWSGPDRCVWGWMSVDDGRGGAITVGSPSVPSRGTTVYGTGYKHRRLINGTYKYSFSSNAFIFEPLLPQG